jgi:hypothetical protein
MAPRTGRSAVRAMSGADSGLMQAASVAPILVRGLAHIRAIAPELDRAIAATHRYRELKRMAPERGNPATDPAHTYALSSAGIVS